MSDANNGDEDIIDMTIMDVDGNLQEVDKPQESEHEANKAPKRKRQSKLRSFAWTHFTRNPVNQDECICNHCKKKLKCSQKGGTTHLNRHIKDGLCPVYKRKQQQESEPKGQTLLDFSGKPKVYESTCHQNEASEKDSSNEAGTSSISFQKNLAFMEEFLKFSEEEDMMHSKSELDVYLEEKLYPRNGGSIDEDFNILDYWKANALKFPILSMMARDILAIPVSSVASESAFSTGGRVLNQFRSSLLPYTVEGLVCGQDWIRSSPKEIDYAEEFDSSFADLKLNKK